MKQYIKRFLGIDQLEQEKQSRLEEIENIKLLKEQYVAESVEAEAAAKLAKLKAEEEAALAKLSLKEKAIANKEPWVSVLETHVSPTDVRNGFFELDWNEYFVLQLRAAGYQGDTDEAVVDLWFQDLCRNVGAESGVDMTRRGSGYVNRALRDDGKTEIY
jgi:hypothetical protein